MGVRGKGEMVEEDRMTDRRVGEGGVTPWIRPNCRYRYDPIVATDKTQLSLQIRPNCRYRGSVTEQENANSSSEHSSCWERD